MRASALPLLMGKSGLIATPLTASFSPGKQRVGDGPIALQQTGFDFDRLVGEGMYIGFERAVARQRDADVARARRHSQAVAHSLEFLHVADKQSINKDGGPGWIH